MKTSRLAAAFGSIARAALPIASLAWLAAAHAGDVQVAVAANFAAPMERIAGEFAKDTGNRALVITGSTGKLYAEITNGAAFEVFLAADAQTPKRLEDEGYTVAGRRFTYATGKLVLYSATPGLVDDQGAVLRSGRFQHLAIANPKTAPYGAAAVEALKALGLWDAVQARLVVGESIAQAYQFTASGNADLGFVALSELHAPGHPPKGSWWLVPANLYRPIRQDAVLLKKGADDPAARALFDYLRTEKARSIIRAYGYEL